MQAQKIFLQPGSINYSFSLIQIIIYSNTKMSKKAIFEITNTIEHSNRKGNRHSNRIQIWNLKYVLQTTWKNFSWCAPSNRRLIWTKWSWNARSRTKISTHATRATNCCYARPLVIYWHIKIPYICKPIQPFFANLYAYWLFISLLKYRMHTNPSSFFFAKLYAYWLFISILKYRMYANPSSFFAQL